MKKIFSLIALLLFLCFHTQIKDSLDSDKDGIADFEDACPTIKGQKEYNGCDCLIVYNENKKQFERNYNQLKKIDFKNFFDVLFKKNILKEIVFNKTKILLLSEIRFDSSEGDGSCPHYDKNIEEEIFKRLWNKNNFSKIQNKLKDKIIIPLGKLTFEENIKEKEKNNYINQLIKNKIENIYKGEYIDSNKEKKYFYYFSKTKPIRKLLLHKTKDDVISEKFLDFGIKISPYEIEKNTYKVMILFVDEKGQIKEDEFIFQYKNGKWINLNN